MRFARLLLCGIAFVWGWLSMEPVCQAQEPQKTAGAKAPPSLDELLLFFPAKYPAGNWKPRDLRFKDVWFTAADGTRLHGWYCPCDKPRATILIAHGNAGNVALQAPWLLPLRRGPPCCRCCRYGYG